MLYYQLKYKYMVHTAVLILHEASLGKYRQYVY